MMDTNEWLLVIAGIAVVIGVFMEGWEHWEDIKKNGWRPLTPKIGFAILVLGLFVEKYAEIRIGQADTKFRVDAINRIGQLTEHAAKFNREAGEFRKAAADSRLETQKLRATNLKFERLLGPRAFIGGEDFEKLRKFKGITVWVQQVPSPSFDPTGSNLAAGAEDVSEFANSCAILKVLAWKVNFVSQPIIPPSLQGVRVLSFRAYPDKILADNPTGDAAYTMPLDTPAERSWGAAEAFTQYLRNDLGLMDSVHWGLDNLKGEIPPPFDQIRPVPTPDVVIVQVGYKGESNLSEFKFDQELDFERQP